MASSMWSGDLLGLSVALLEIGASTAVTRHKHSRHKVDVIAQNETKGPSCQNYFLCRGSMQFVVPPTVPAPRVAEYCGLQATSGWIRFPLTLFVPENDANDRSLTDTPLPPFPVIT